ncbi:MAG: hypothetical protein OXR72_14375 [Gemmatimonadota bacterium]|nr:hypothetical protein [Gemmatimonadota bacterium]
MRGNVNLRCLGALHTLVLINSRRQVNVLAQLFGGLTHNPKGRRIKPAATCALGR